MSLSKRKDTGLGADVCKRNGVMTLDFSSTDQT